MAELELKPMPPPPLEPDAYDSGDPKQVKKKREKAANKDTKSINDWKTVLELPAGRRVLYEIIGLGKPYNDLFSTNALTMGRLTGMAAVSNLVIDKIAQADPRAYAHMQLENFEEATNG